MLAVVASVVLLNLYALIRRTDWRRRFGLAGQDQAP
jgi:hypothetical protein